MCLGKDRFEGPSFAIRSVPGKVDRLNLKVRLKSVLVEERGAPAEMGNMELFFLDVGVY